jgi:hypothetical protein
MHLVQISYLPSALLPRRANIIAQGQAQTRDGLRGDLASAAHCANTCSATQESAQTATSQNHKPVPLKLIK